jgi:hypothetical protein
LVLQGLLINSCSQPPHDEEELFQIDNIITVQRIAISFEPIVTSNWKYLKKLLEAAWAVHSSAGQPGTCHEHVLTLLHKTLAWGGPLTAGVELRLELDLSPREGNVLTLLDKEEYEGQMKGTASDLIAHLQAMLRKKLLLLLSCRKEHPLLFCVRYAMQDQNKQMLD